MSGGNDTWLDNAVAYPVRKGLPLFSVFLFEVTKALNEKVLCKTH
jgi:hypothetical protein